MYKSHSLQIVENMVEEPHNSLQVYNTGYSFFNEDEQSNNAPIRKNQKNEINESNIIIELVAGKASKNDAERGTVHSSVACSVLTQTPTSAVDYL